MPSGTRPLPGPLSVAVGKILAKAHEAAGLTQVSVANRVGMSAAQFSRALRGQKALTLDQFEAACDAIGLDVVKTLGSADRAAREEKTMADVVELRPAAGPSKTDVRLPRVAKRKSRDRGGDDGQG